jgi:hypothetical protein
MVVGAAATGFRFVAGTPADEAAAREAASDAARVFCLSHEQQLRLTEAAAHLAVAIPQDELREGKGPEFDRVCAALTGAAQIPQQATRVPIALGEPTSDVLLSVTVGSLLAWLTGFWRDERTQSRLLADSLRTAAGNYLSAAHAQRRKWYEPGKGKLPVDQVVLDGRDELAGQVHKVAVQRPSWTVPRRLQEQLSDARLGESMNDPRPGESREQRDEALQKALHSLRHSIDTVVGALERPWRWHGDMRRKHPAGTEATGAE